LHSELVILVHEWELANKAEPEGAAAKDVIKRLAAKVKSFGVQFAEGTGDDCAAAVSILVRASSFTKL